MKNSFYEISKNDLLDVNGGVIPFVITGAMVIKGIGLLASGVAFGTVIGKTIKGIFKF